MSVVASWLGSGVRASSAALTVTAVLHPSLLRPLLVTGIALITILVLTAVFSRDPIRRSDAYKILKLLWPTPRPQQPPTHTPRRRGTPPAPGKPRALSSGVLLLARVDRVLGVPPQRVEPLVAAEPIEAPAAGHA